MQAGRTRTGVCIHALISQSHEPFVLRTCNPIPTRLVPDRAALTSGPSSVKRGNPQRHGSARRTPCRSRIKGAVLGRTENRRWQAPRGEAAGEGQRTAVPPADPPAFCVRQAARPGRCVAHGACAGRADNCQTLCLAPVACAAGQEVCNSKGRSPASLPSCAAQQTPMGPVGCPLRLM